MTKEQEEYLMDVILYRDSDDSLKLFDLVKEWYEKQPKKVWILRVGYAGQFGGAFHSKEAAEQFACSKPYLGPPQSWIEVEVK